MSRGVVEHRCFYVMGWNRGRAHDAPSHIGALESPGGGGGRTPKRKSSSSATTRQVQCCKGHVPKLLLHINKLYRLKTTRHKTQLLSITFHFHCEF